MNNLELFSIRLKQARISSGFTQEALAELAEVGKSAIANYEAGRNLPKPPVLKKLATALGRSAESLLQNSESHQEDDDEMQFNPRLEEMLERLMEAEGYDTKKEFFAAVIREKAAQLGGSPAKGALDTAMDELDATMSREFGD